MQQVMSPPRPPTYPYRNGNRGRSSYMRPQSIIIAAITLFALSGLLIGFAVGALNHPKLTQTTITTTSKGSTPVAARQTTPTATSIKHPEHLGWPVIDNSTYIQKADGVTAYTFSAHPVDQSIDLGHGKPVYASTIICKMWLTKDDDATKTLISKQDKLKNINALSQPLPTEIPNGLTFTTPQILPCSTSGATNWTYTIPAATPTTSVNYYLVVLTDWQGIYYNWTVKQIKIIKGND